MLACLRAAAACLRQGAQFHSLGSVPALAPTADAAGLTWRKTPHRWPACAGVECGLIGCVLTPVLPVRNVLPSVLQKMALEKRTWWCQAMTLICWVVWELVEAKEWGHSPFDQAQGFTAQAWSLRPKHCSCLSVLVPLQEHFTL